MKCQGEEKKTMVAKGRNENQGLKDISFFLSENDLPKEVFLKNL